MKIATDRETIATIRPIHNASAALGYRPGHALNQYDCGGKKILLCSGRAQAIPKKIRANGENSNS